MIKDKVKKSGGYSFVNSTGGVYAISYSTTEEQLMTSILNMSGSWENSPAIVGGVKVVPHGSDNNFPANVRNLLEKNNLGPGILGRKTGLAYGRGPFLYSLKFENGEITRDWKEDAEIQKWLDGWDYKAYVRNAIQEFNYMQGFYAKIFPGKGYTRTGSDYFISKIECEPGNECRMEWPEDGNRIEDVKSIIVWDFENMNRRMPAVRYPVFKAGAKEVSIKYCSFRSFARNFYALSSFVGAIPWVRRANDIPDIIEYLTNNMIAASYHIHEPKEYWDNKEELLRMKYPEDDDMQIYERMETLRDEMTKTISNVLSGKRNSGKFFESIDFVDENGTQCSWKIEAIDFNIDKFIEAQSKISVIADSSTTSGFGLNPALSNIIIEGKGDSGSQILYAWKLFYAADTQIAEDIVMEPINQALRINFPGKKLSMGLYQPVAAKESDVSAQARAKSTV